MRLLLIHILFLCMIPFTANIQAQGKELEQARHYLDRARLLYARSEYDSLPFYYLTAFGIFDDLQLYVQASECKLGMVDFYRMHNRQAEAESSLRKAESYITENTGRDSPSWADALFVRAKLYTTRNMNREAIDLLAECLILQEKLEVDGNKKGGTLNVLGASYFNLGDAENAEHYYLEALKAFSELQEGPSPEKGIVLYNLGLVASRRHDYEKWAEYNRRTIENNVVVHGPEYPDLTINYISLSSFYINSGKLDSASLYLDKSEQLLVDVYGPQYYKLSDIYINRARIHTYEGDYSAALEYYLASLNIIENQEIVRRSSANVAYVNIGSLYSNIGEYESAHEYLSRLLDSEGLIHPVRMARYYNYLADISIKLGRYEEAESYLARISEIETKHPGSDKTRMARAYLSRGILMDSLGKPDEAYSYYSEALEQAIKAYGQHHLNTARINDKLGTHFMHWDNPQEALGYYQQAIYSLHPGYNVEEPGINPDPGSISSLLFYLEILKGKAEAIDRIIAEAKSTRDTGLYLASYSTLVASVDAIEILRTSYLSDESKLYLSDNERNTYERCVESAYRCFNITGEPIYLARAFTIAEKAKYATLRSVLQREEALNLELIPDSIRQIESGLKQRLSVYEELLIEEENDTLPDQVLIESYKTEIFKLKDRVSSILRSLEEEYPGYYELLYNQKYIEPIKIMKKLARDERLLEYFMVGNDCYIFSLSKEGMVCSILNMNDSIRMDLDFMTHYLGGSSIYDSLADDHEAFRAASYRLYGKLIPEAGIYKSMIVIPEAELSYLPFDVLLTEDVGGQDITSRDLPFLIKDQSVRYGYSAALLFNQKRKSPGRMTRFVGFAPGYLSEGLPETSATRKLHILREDLDPLPGSIREVNLISDMLGGVSYTGPVATESQFRSNSHESHIIHLATHAFLDDADPLNSTLVFSEEEYRSGADSIHDGFLNVHELYNISFNARLVVLSACNTGMGEMHGGEGIISLARAFIYSGVPNIVMTLWTVSDRQSTGLMQNFYWHLRKGKRAENSLRKAKLEYIENARPADQHPKYWAAYILAGNPENLFFHLIYRIAIIVAAGLFLLASLGYFLGRRSRRKHSNFA